MQDFPEYLCTIIPLQFGRLEQGYNSIPPASLIGLKNPISYKIVGLATIKVVYLLDGSDDITHQ